MFSKRSLLLRRIQIHAKPYEVDQNPEAVTLEERIRVFLTFDDIVGHCCEAWNKFTDQPWRIMSIGLRDWAHRFSYVGAGISFHRDIPTRHE